MPITLVSYDTDQIVPPFLADELAERASSIHTHVRIRTIFGHDGFLKEATSTAAAVQASLEVAR